MKVVVAQKSTTPATQNSTSIGVPLKMTSTELQINEYS
jgi:hypothetical protein